MLRILMLACLAANCGAGVIYSDFGAPPAVFDPGSGVLISGNEPSVAFTPSGAASVAEIDFVASMGSISDVNQLTVILSADNAGAPGASLAQNVFTGMMGVEGSVSDPPGIIQWVLASPVPVAAGTQYWVTFEAPAGGDVIWNSNTTGAYGDDIYNGSSWTSTAATIGALDIESATGAPEPSTLGLMLCSIGIASLRRVRRRCAGDKFRVLPRRS